MTSARSGTSGNSAPPLYLVPDDADRRELLELQSHWADLSDAGFALDQALDLGRDHALWLPLTMYSTTAYIRPFIHSNVRKRLDTRDDYRGVPEALRRLHNTVRNYRNATVAHSQSDLATSLAVAVLDHEGVLTDVMHWTAYQPMPVVIAEAFAQLIGSMEEQVESMMSPFRARLRDRWAGSGPDVMADWEPPRLAYIRDRDFSGTRSRSHRLEVPVFYTRQESGTGDSD